MWVDLDMKWGNIRSLPEIKGLYMVQAGIVDRVYPEKDHKIQKTMLKVQDGHNLYQQFHVMVHW